MAGFREREKRHFPLQNIQAVVNLFRDQLENNDQPNLALLSIIVGVIENTLTVNRATSAAVDTAKNLEPIFPVVELSTVEALYQKFATQVKGSVDLSQYSGEYASRDLVKKVSDVIWNSLTRSYHKDKAHLQTLYAYLTGNKLDCFGVSFAVVAACQLLALHDVHLALSEDHAWVVFGEDGTETAEVTWHGKGIEDKRGQPVTQGVAERSWLYLMGDAVVCTRQLEVAALVSSINPAISSTADSVEMSALQQDLLWLLYDMGTLEKYPMALGNLGDLEEISPTAGRPSPMVLFRRAIESSRHYYHNRHVYPYTYLGSYFCRRGMFKEAFRSWAEAANVIRIYNYNREDEEIYKEFLEIANELIPQIVKQAADSQQHAGPPGTEPPPTPQMAGLRHLLRDPECYADLLRFYDGICEWEEGSQTPVLHVGWAKFMCFSLSRFHSSVRQALEVHAEGEKEEAGDGEGLEGVEGKGSAEGGEGEKDGGGPVKGVVSLKRRHHQHQLQVDVKHSVETEKASPGGDVKRAKSLSPSAGQNGRTAANGDEGGGGGGGRRRQGRPPGRPPKHRKSLPSPNETTNLEPPAETTNRRGGSLQQTKPHNKAVLSSSNNNEPIDGQQQKAAPEIVVSAAPHQGMNGKPSPAPQQQQSEERIKSTIQELESKVGAQESSQNETTNPNIVALAQACGESILNPEYLLSGGEPFASHGGGSGTAAGGANPGPSPGPSPAQPGTSPAFAASSTTDTRVDFNEFLSSKSNGSPFRGMTMDSMLKAESPADMLLYKAASNGQQAPRPDSGGFPHPSELAADDNVPRPGGGGDPGRSLLLHSAKMKGLKDLLTSAKLNASAIKLQLTAQSQVQLKHSKVNSEYEFTLPRKRLRRE